MGQLRWVGELNRIIFKDRTHGGPLTGDKGPSGLRTWRHRPTSREAPLNSAFCLTTQTSERPTGR